MQQLAKSPSSDSTPLYHATSGGRQSLAIITTIPATMYFLLANQIPFIIKQGIRITLIAGSSDWVTTEHIQKRYGIEMAVIPLTREYSVAKDIAALWKLVLLLMKSKPDIIHYSTPKAAFIGSLAAFFARVPKRIYTIRGMVYYGKKPPISTLLEGIERITCTLSTHVIAVSRSNLEYIIGKGLCASAKIKILANGSSQGVDARGRFNRDNLDSGKLADIKSICSLPPGFVVIGFIGRIAEDKGIGELLSAWRRIKGEITGACLLMLGPDIEKRNRLSEESMKELREDSTIFLKPAVENIEYYYPLIDFIVLPSHREGFPNVVLEAAAMEIPAITYDSPGCIDSVVDEVTGFVVQSHNVKMLGERIVQLVKDPVLRKTLGANARKRVLDDFNPDMINQELVGLYDT